MPQAFRIQPAQDTFLQRGGLVCEVPDSSFQADDAGSIPVVRSNRFTPEDPSPSEPEILLGYPRNTPSLRHLFERYSSGAWCSVSTFERVSLSGSSYPSTPEGVRRSGQFRGAMCVRTSSSRCHVCADLFVAVPRADSLISSETRPGVRAPVCWA